MKEIIKYLKNCSLFADLDEKYLTEIAGLVRDRHYAKGHLVFIEGDTGEAIFILKKGLVKLAKRTEDGREHILQFIHPGEVFAEVVLFDNGEYPVTAEVQKDSLIGVIRNKDMEQLIGSHPDIAIAILRIMGKRLRIAQERAVSLALNDVRRRLIFILLEMAAEYGKKMEEGIVIDFALTNQELASMIGTSRESANRIISDLKKSGLVDVNRRQIIIKDRQKLRSLM